jgi:glutathione S-transferase
MGLAEKGVAYTLQTCGPHSPEVLAVTPFGRIPGFRDGDFGLFETSAILRYVDEAFDGPPLLPGTIAGRARCEQWVSATNAYLYDTMVRRYVLQFIFPRGEGGRPDGAVIASALKEMPAQLAALDRACEAGGFLAGPGVSLADLFVAPILAYVELMPEGKALLAAAPHLMRAQAQVRERASFTSTQPPQN